MFENIEIKAMIARTSALAFGALIGLSLSWSALARDLSAPPSPPSAGVLVAQYAGPPFGGPPGYDGPDEGNNPSPGYGGGPAYGAQSGDEPRQRSPRPSSRSAGAGIQHVTTYHGFRIDLSETSHSRNLASEVAAMEHQIDIVGSVGLSMADLSLFRSLPIRISNSMHGGGHYDGGPIVQMGSLAASDRRPVLLHEFMHVYHHSHLPGGFQNPDVRGFYEEAVSRNLYPAGSYMLKNAGEFFAMTASCYLYGSVARPPNSRETIRTHQPDYYAYLGRLFGAPHGFHSSGSAQNRVTTPGHGERMPVEGAYK